MAYLVKEEYLTFDDVLILPQFSDIDTRTSISLDNDFLGLKLGLPIISANMDYVTGKDMAVAMWDAGGLGILHRFMPENELDSSLRHLNLSGAPLAFSVGVREPEKVESFVRNITQWARMRPDYPTIVCIDVAHGQHSQVARMIYRLKKLGVKIIAGNVATASGYALLANEGADAVKVGIGPGSVCTTREVTGVGVPQLSALLSIDEFRRETYNDVVSGPLVIADGGLKNSGDIVKALAAGADVVMLGNLLAGSSECPGERVTTASGRVFHPYRGQSIFGTNGLRNTPEGISGFVEEKGPVKGVLERLGGGIRSGMSYVGARNLTELRESTVFIKTSHGTKVESMTRVKETYG